mgnify:CR=1 FL=1|tara:strand:+ start:363 stop:653 length:291 start_codon:yes stop_codon:yes gene_type:complete
MRNVRKSAALMVLQHDLEVLGEEKILKMFRALKAYTKDRATRFRMTDGPVFSKVLSLTLLLTGAHNEVVMTEVKPYGDAVIQMFNSLRWNAENLIK